MEEKQRNYIHHNVEELSKQTTCHSLFIAFFESRNILSEFDVSQLNSIDNRLKKSLAFYKIISQRSYVYDVLCEALKETGQSGALQILERIKPIRFDVRQPVHLFTGREEELIKLHEHLTQSQNIATLITHTASVTGLGGIGKTELCRKYIENYSTHYDENVIWIGAEKPELMENSFRTLAKDLLNISMKDVEGGDKEIQTVVDEVYNYFREKKCLFIFDNAVSSNDEHLTTFLPVRVTNHPNLLITSRDRDWELPMHVLELDELKEIEAVEFVKKGLTIQDDNQNEIIVALVTKLQRFPLAIQQAISFIKEQRNRGRFEIQQYLESFDEESKVLLNHQISPFLSNKYAKTTYTTWKITTDFISADKECGNQAICMLNMISYFEPDKIPSELLTNGQNWNEDEMHYTLQLLVKYSMINIQPTAQSISIHRLVQEVTRVQLRKNKTEELTLKTTMEHMSVNIQIDYVNHICSVFKYCGAYKTLVIKFKYVIWMILATYYIDRNSKCILSVATALRDVLQDHVCSDDVDLLKLERKIAEEQYYIYGLKIGLESLERILPIYLKNKTGIFSDGELVLTEQQYASVLKEQGKPAEGLGVLIKLFQKCKLLKEENHWRTISVLFGIANSLVGLGHFKTPPPENSEYLQLLNDDFRATDPHQIISVLKTEYENYKHLIHSNNNYAYTFYGVAICLQNLGDMDMASLIARESYEVGKNSSGALIFTTMNFLTLLANIKREQGKLEDAIAMYQEVHTFLSSKLGVNNINTLTAKWTIHQSQRDLGETDSALDGFQDVLKPMLKYYPKAVYSIKIELDIAEVLYKMKRYNDSLGWLVPLKAKLQESSPQLESLMSKVNDLMEEVKKFVN